MMRGLKKILRQYTRAPCEDGYFVLRHNYKVIYVSNCSMVAAYLPVSAVQSKHMFVYMQSRL